MKFAAVLLGSISLFCAGCGEGIYPASPRGFTDLSTRSSWLAGGTLSNAQAAVDGDLNTAAVSDYQYAGADITVDLQRPCLFQMVVLHHGKAELGFARRVAVSTSLDGNIFIDRYVAPDLRKLATLSLPSPVLARYVRIKAIVPGSIIWNIAEIYLE